MKYVEKRILGEEELRSLCIRRGWYTCGDCKQYERLFKRLRDKNGHLVNMTAGKLAEIATDIMEHSHLDDDYDLTFVMSIIVKECTSVFSDHRRKV